MTILDLFDDTEAMSDDAIEALMNSDDLMDLIDPIERAYELNDFDAMYDPEDMW